MCKSLEVRDSLYYDDLMYELERSAGFDVDGDYALWERLEERKKGIRADEVIGTTTLQTYDISPFQKDLFEIVRWISKRANDSFCSISDISQYPLLVLEALVQLEKKKEENEMLIQLISIIKDMGLVNEFSLGQDAEQRVCLNKNGILWEVYIVERGIYFEKSVYEDCFDACVEVINQLADSKQMYEEAKEKFGMVRKLVPNK